MAAYPDEELGDEPIDRFDSLIRIVKTIVLALVLEVARTALVALIVFSHGWALITQDPPPERVRRFADRANALVYRIYRFMTYNESDPPFPWSDFPEPIEAERPRASLDARISEELRSTEI